MRSRIVTGFHRLGLVVAVPLVAIGLAGAFYAIVFTDGYPVPDPTSKPEVPVYVARDGLPDRTTIPLSAPEKNLIHIQVGNRSFKLVTNDPLIPIHSGIGSDLSPEQNKRLDATVKALLAEERRRGDEFDAEQLPLLIGSVIVYPGSDRYDYAKEHLRRDYNWEGFSFGLAGAGLGLAAYIIARALGWILDGFFGRSPSGA